MLRAAKGKSPVHEIEEEGSHGVELSGRLIWRVGGRLGEFLPKLNIT
jgi:hypothetical protein